MTNERKNQITETLKKYPYALAAQGGGLVIYNESQNGYVFVLAPEWAPQMLGKFMDDDCGTGPSVMAE